MKDRNKLTKEGIGELQERFEVWGIEVFSSICKLFDKKNTSKYENNKVDQCCKIKINKIVRSIIVSGNYCKSGKC